jgi:2-polyprenyl-3-methyl-5-hydroxy-6-metoxy-1,4-benzoquinol methylase
MTAGKPRAVAVHDEQAELFERRYEALRRNPYHDPFTYSRRKIEQVLVRYLDALPDGARLLDVGCGTGDLLSRLGERFECAGCDPSDEMLERARRHNPNAAIKRATAEELPYGGGSYDVVLCIEVTRYLAAPAAALSEIARVLTPGGLALVTFAPARSTTLYPIVNTLTSRVSVPGMTRVRQYFHNAGEVEQLVAAAGLERGELHARFFGPFVYLSRLTRVGTSGLLRRWEQFDDRLAKKPALREFANVFVVAAWKPATSSTSPAPR